MPDDRFDRLREILLEASELPATQRPAFLDQACGDDRELRDEIESLLAHEEKRRTILRTGGVEERLSSPDAAELFAGETGDALRIGPYQILEILGQGGMGVVYRARQTEPIQREVALKLVGWGRATPGMIARFETERRTLALMSHPNIARVLDAGADEAGRPYFVMELVEGVPLLAFCEEAQLGVRARVELAIAICRAVHHAHQKGIIHRDLKPSNILVELFDGVPTPKVIDFGIAKAMEETGDEAGRLTREGQLVGTVRYMSPEQARGASREIDTRSDVYSLGAILYELLTGTVPCGSEDASLMEQIRVVNEDPPRPFGTVLPVGQRLNADLEVVCFKALAKDPAERYQSAAALGDDLERYLTSQPILARPPSAVYQLRKLIARHRIPSLLTAGITVLVIVFAVGMSILYGRAESNYRRAVQAEREATQVSDFMIELFEISDPGEARGSSITAREVLDMGADRIGDGLQDQPSLAARWMLTMARVYRGLGLYERARDLLEAAVTRRTPGDDSAPDDDLQAAILDNLARVLQLQGRDEEALPRYEEALRIRAALFGSDHPRVAASMTNLATEYARFGRSEEAAALYEHAREVLERTSPGSLLLSGTLMNLARLYTGQRRLGEAEELYTQAVAICRRQLPPDHPDLAVALSNLADFYITGGRYKEAEPPALEAREIMEKVLGPVHPDLAVVLTNLARLYEDWAQYEKAAPLLERALSILEGTLEPDHPQLAVALNNLGRLYHSMGRLDEAEETLGRTIEIRERIYGADHPRVATSVNSLGEVSLTRGDLARADSLFRRAYDIRVAEYGPDDTRTVYPLHNLGLVSLQQGRLAEAEPRLRHALDIRRQKMGPDHNRIAESLQACARLCRQQGRLAEADSLDAQAAAMWARLR